MTNNCLKYLDTVVILQDKKLELRQFHKPETVVINYKNAVSPLHHFTYKNSCLCGEIFRARHCTSNDINLNLALIILNKYSKIILIRKKL